MINFHYETNFNLSPEETYQEWLQAIATSEEHHIAELNYIFCNDTYLHKINVEYLNHDTYTDIISFDYTENDEVAGDIFISVERVRENAYTFKVSFHNELLRVMAHGLLHLCGYGDKTTEEETLMRSKEEEKIKMFHGELNL